MKKANKLPDDDMRTHYDFTNAVRNPYATLIKQNSRAIALDDDIAQIFTSSEQIEKALGYLLEFAQTHTPTDLIRRANLREPKPSYQTTNQTDLATTSSDMVLSVMVSPDILEVFPTAHAINEALRTLIYLAAYVGKLAT